MRAQIPGSGKTVDVHIAERQMKGALREATRKWFICPHCGAKDHTVILYPDKIRCMHCED